MTEGSEKSVAAREANLLARYRQSKKSADPAEREEAALLLRWAAAELNDTERRALQVYIYGIPLSPAGKELGFSHSTFFMAQRTALRKMRIRLNRAGFTSSSQIMSPR